MKKIVLIIGLVFFFQNVIGQELHGKVINDFITSASLVNETGESVTRKLSIYLPPDYDQSDKKYPVLYYLHGFFGNDSIRKEHIKILDLAISTKRIRPMIFMISDQFIEFGGSFYSNSVLNGNWSDFTAIDIVEHMDKNFRTIAQKESRGICGHSMGGYGALKISMLYPDVFSSVYALSPGLLAIVKEYGPNSNTYKEYAAIKTKEEMLKTYFPRLIVAISQAWSPNLNKPPFYCDVPFNYENEMLVVDQKVLDKWNKNLPISMLDANAENLRKMKAIKLDWGRNDFGRFSVQCKMFSQKLENLGIEHYAEEYIGTHGNKIWTEDGRILNSMLPFFNTYLSF